MGRTARRTVQPTVVAALVAALVAAMSPSAGEARPRLGPRAVFGILGAPLGVFRQVIRPRAGRSRAVTSAARRARAGAALAVGASAVWAGTLYWPHGFLDMAGYAFGDTVAGARFWSGGSADVLAALVTPPAARGRASADAGASETTGAATATRPPCASAPAAAVADLVAGIEERIEPNDSQRAAFAALRTAFEQAGEDLRQACPEAATAGEPTGAPARLASMRERLWAIQSAALSVREPLADLYRTLDAEQKQRFDAAPARDAKPGRRAPAPAIPAQLCHLQAQSASERTAARIRDAVSLSAEQEAPFRTLVETSAGMSRLAVTSCPTEPPANAVARLDAVLDRLDAMLYAVVVVATPLDIFYASLTDEQKTQFDALAGGPQS